VSSDPATRTNATSQPKADHLIEARKIECLVWVLSNIARGIPAVIAVIAPRESSDVAHEIRLRLRRTTGASCGSKGHAENRLKRIQQKA
jgi:hypothetical protein